MKKFKLFISCFIILVSIFGCGKDEVADTYADVSNKDEALSSNKGDALTIGQVYDYLRENSDEVIAKNIFKDVMKKQLNIDNDTDMMSLYEKYLNEYFKETFVDNETYKYDGEFNEDLVVKYLRSESYSVLCGDGYTSGKLDSEYFTCDYTDYINKEVDYDIFLKMLKVKYVLDEKTSLIDRKEARKISYYSVSRSSSTDYETRENLEKYVQDILTNHASDDGTLIRSLEDVANIHRTEDLDEIEEEYNKVNTSSDSNFNYLEKYTTCGDKRCTLEEGKEYQENLINEKEYIVTKVVTKDDTSVLYEGVRDVLFSENVEDYLFTIGTNKYLMSPVYGEKDSTEVRDIVLFDGSSTYYVVIVELIDSSSSFENKVSVAELLVDTISESEIFDYYLEDTDLKIYDKQIKEYFIEKYGEYEKE